MYAIRQDGSTMVLDGPVTVASTSQDQIIPMRLFGEIGGTTLKGAGSKP